MAGRITKNELNQGLKNEIENKASQLDLEDLDTRLSDGLMETNTQLAQDVQNLVLHEADNEAHESTENPTANRIAMFDNIAKLRIPKNTLRDMRKNDNFFRPAPIVYTDNTSFEVGSKASIPISEFAPNRFETDYQGMLVAFSSSPGASGRACGLAFIAGTSNATTEWQINVLIPISNVSITHNATNNTIEITNNTGATRIIRCDCMMF